MRRTVTAFLIIGVVLPAGCARADDRPVATRAESPPAATRAGSPPVAPSTTDQCGDVGAAVRDHLGSSDVRTVTVNGQCTNVTIETGLDDEDNAGGRQLCEAAAEVAYVGDINAVTVVSRSGAELSAGIPGMKCLP